MAARLHSPAEFAIEGMLVAASPLAPPIVILGRDRLSATTFVVTLVSACLAVFSLLVSILLRSRTVRTSRLVGGVAVGLLVVSLGPLVGHSPAATLALFTATALAIFRLLPRSSTPPRSPIHSSDQAAERARWAGGSASLICAAELLYSLEACEDMLTVLANPTASEALSPGAAAIRFDEAYDRAMGNITEPDESVVLQKIAEDRDAALNSAAAARSRMIEAIRKRSDINRQAMLTADLRAQQLGRAGAWSVAIMAALSFLVQLIALRLLHERVLVPLVEFRSVVDGQRHGETRRRFSSSHATSELHDLYDGLNELLDQRPRSPLPLTEEAIRLPEYGVPGDASNQTNQPPSR